MKFQPYLSVHQLTLYRAGFEGTMTIGFFYNADDEFNEQMQSFLSAEEIDSYNLLAEAKKNAFVSGRYIAKHCLQHTLPDYHLNEFKITNGIFGQPWLENEANLHLSISHTNCASACIVFPREHPMGLDLQKIDTRARDAIKSQLTSTELEIADIENYYIHLWTCKEALSKILQTGLMVPMSVLEIEKIDFCNGFLMSYYKNFSQYKAISFQWQHYICSIVLPANTTINVQLLLKNLSASPLLSV
ncbi:MAG: 4'-phosphopantetheinyl transferase family protein [Cyclobacteriaceae bacterium]